MDSDRLRLIERCLSDGARQVEGAANFRLSADLRAITLAGTYISTGTALAAGLLAWTTIPYPLLVGGMLSAGLFYIGGIICIGVAFLEISQIAGNPPSFWKFHLDKSNAYEDSLFTQIEEYERKIIEYNAMLKRIARRYQWGAQIGAAAPVVGVLTYFAL
jgi:hypothetical protein